MDDDVNRVLTVVHVWGTLDMSPIYGSSGGCVYSVWGWGSAEPP